MSISFILMDVPKWLVLAPGETVISYCVNFPENGKTVNNQED